MHHRDVGAALLVYVYEPPIGTSRGESPPIADAPRTPPGVTARCRSALTVPNPRVRVVTRMPASRAWFSSGRSCQSRRVVDRLGFAAALCGAVALATGAGSLADTVSFTLNTTSSAWVDTGIAIPAGGVATLAVTGNGRCGSLSDCPPGDPLGSRVTCAARTLGSLLAGPGGADIAYGAVAARVGSSGKPFQIGASGSASGPGELFLLYNDCAGYYADNGGSFTVTVSQTAPSAPGTVRLMLVITGSGSVSTSSGGFTCSGSCPLSVPTKSLVTLQANATASSTFRGWTQGCVGTGPSCVAYADSPNTIDATFGPPFAQLDAVVSGNGTVSGAGLNCGPQSPVCDSFADQGAAVTLMATAGADSVFVGWSGDCAAAGAARSCTVTAAASTDVAAVFDLRAPAGGSHLLKFSGAVQPISTTATTAVAAAHALLPTTTTTTATTAVAPVVTTTPTPPAGCVGHVCTFAAAEIPTMTTLTGSNSSSMSWSGGCVGFGPTCPVVADHLATIVKSVLFPPVQPKCLIHALRRLSDDPCVNPGGGVYGSPGGAPLGSGVGVGAGSWWPLTVVVWGGGVVKSPELPAFACRQGAPSQMCQARLPHYTPPKHPYRLTLKAKPDTHHHLVEWAQPAPCGHGISCKIPADGSIDAVAVFTSK